MRKTFPINHDITCDSSQVFSGAQICEISPEVFANETEGSVLCLPPGVPVLVQLSNGKQFLCRLFAPPDRHLSNRTVCFVDECVQFCGGSYVVGAEKDVPQVKELEVILEELCSFQRIRVDLSIDCFRLDLELLINESQLLALVKGLLRTLFVSKGCLVKPEEKSNCGIVEIGVVTTAGPHNFGYIDTGTKIDIGTISFNKASAKVLGGLSETKESLLKALGRGSENILIAGPPGSGKSSLIAELARDGNHPVFEVRGLDFIKSHPGETELELRKIFERLISFNKLFHRTSPAILVVKDVDTLCPKLDYRKGEDVSNISRISSQFTSLLDCHHGRDSGILVIATSSNIESLDAKVRRPGRLGTEIYVRMPSETQRKEIIEAVLKRTGFSLEESDLDEIIRRSPGYVGADLELLVYTIQRTLSRQPCQDVQSAIEDCIKKIRPTSLRSSIGLISGLTQTLDSIGGMDELKKVLRISVLGPLRRPEAFRRFGMSPLKGILLYGPPGCAKTTIAKCLAAESRMTFVSVSAAEVYSPYVGDSEKLIAKLFNQARLSAPAVIFLDEIDSLVGNRGMQGVRTNDVHIRVLSTLLTEMDGIGSSVQSSIGSSVDSKNILVIAATNRPDMIDDALLRPGRLTKLIHVPAPDETARFEILKKVSEVVPLAQDVDLVELAKQTVRYSGADLQNLCSQAALHAAALDEDVQKVAMEHFQHVLKENRPSLTSKQIEWYNEYEANRRIV
ncbi:AAEL000836-PA [Aedes aegypti]|uniref:AAEL000836-PA n=2 Tax=Aedes aegypti TaxID=7159 RepID=A0A1S4EWZ7_AEDAE|nr:spermatogenesis-associated protein 5-like protein 1 [Aedes aegypti]EAT48123.1 AAEL000836-PA [Aedes aegypti]